MWKAIASRLGGRPAAQEAAADWVAQPEEQDRRTVFGLELRKALESDPFFAETLADLLAQARKETGATVADVWSGAVAPAGGGAAGAGGVAIGGSVHGDVVTGSKTTVFDQRGPTVGQQLNVAGNWEPGPGKRKDEGG